MQRASKPLTPENVRQFFVGKGHHNLVLRVADVRRMVNAQQQIVADVMEVVGHPIQERTRPYVLLPWSKIGVLPVELLAKLQDVVYTYKDLRGLQEVESLCPKCGGDGCLECQATGKTTTFQEMSPEEISLAQDPCPAGAWWKE